VVRPNDTSPSTLFVAVVEASGLSSIFGPGTVRRALRDVGKHPNDATADDYVRALPALEARLRAFLEPDDVEGALRRILATVGRPSRSSHPEAPPRR
jgi:hypothetical protein